MPMRKILPFLWWFSAIGGEHPKIHQSAQEGGWVEIPCRYDSGYETYLKYFYKGLYGKMKPLIYIKGKKSKMCTQKGKYELCDDTSQRTLFVTIRDLNLNDAGTYWCLIDAYTYDPRTEIQLEVYKAQTTPLVPLTPPTVASVQTNTRKQQQSATTTSHLNWSKNVSSTMSTPSAETHTVSSPVAGKELYFAAAAVVLLLSLLVVLYCRQKKHRRDRETAAFECEDGSQTNTSSTLIHLENQSWQREPDPSVSPPGSMYTEVTRRRRPDDNTSVCGPVSVQTHMDHPEFSETFTSCPQDDSSAPTISQQRNICRTTATGDHHVGEDVRVVYSTIRFSTEGPIQPRRETTSAAGPSDVYANIRHSKT